MTALKSLGGAAGLLVFAACFFGSEAVVRVPKVSDRQVVTYWEKWTDFEGQAMKDVVDAYNKSQDKYFVQILTVSNIQNKTLLATAGGIPPDVAGLFGPNVAQYALANAAVPLDEFAKRDGIKREDYVEVYWDICSVDGKQWCLPSTPATTAFHYNKLDWKAAGLDPEQPPKTLGELDALAERMMVMDGNKLKRAAFLPAEPGWWNDRWGYVFGARMWDPETGKITADSPDNIEAYTWTQKYAKRFGVDAISDFRQGFGNFSSPQNGFLSGKVSSVLQGVWMYNFISKFAPEMQWDAAPFPYPDGRPELANSTYADQDILIIPRGAKNVEGAWDFIKFVQSQKGMEMLCLGQRKHSPLKKVSPEFWANHPNPRIKLFYDLATSPNAVPPPPLGIWPEYSSEMNNAFNTIAQGTDVKEALSYVTRRMQPKLDRELAVRRKRMEAEKAP